MSDTDLSAYLAEREVDRSIERALDDWCNHMDTEIRRGRLTEEQVTEYTRTASTFQDAWTNWVAGDL